MVEKMSRLRNKRKRLSTKEEWYAFFEEGGKWEANGGPQQTSIYAEAFCKNSQIEPETSQSVLDSSCALGDSFAIIGKFFTNAKLFGSDFSTEAIRRCKEGFPTQVSFLLASFEELTGDYDIVFSSATLEHFMDYKEKARALLRHGKYLCILVPYCETRF